MKSSRPQIILDALLVNEKPTGVGRSILELTKALSCRQWGYDFTLLVTAPQLFHWLEDCPEWSVRNCPGARGGTLRKALFTQWNIPRICKELNADILHSLQFVAPVLLPCSNVVTVHDLAWLRFPDTVEQPRKSYYRLMVPRTLHKASAVVTNSEATAEDVRQYYPKCKNIFVTPFGTPSWVWEDGPNKPAASEKRPFFLFVGTLEPRKNLERILKAYSLMLDRWSNTEEAECPSLVLEGGKGWKDSNLLKLMEPLLQSGDLVVRDYCDIRQLRDLYLKAQVLLFPSLHEGFGFPILEAMAFALPVLTSGVGAMAEVAGKDALLVDPNSTVQLCENMEIIAKSAELRAKLARSGPEWAKKWNWARTAEETVVSYSRILKG